MKQGEIDEVGRWYGIAFLENSCVEALNISMTIWRQVIDRIN